MKYALPTGDAGIIKTLDEVLYICSIRGNNVIAMSRDCKIVSIEIDSTEFEFKKALSQRKFSVVRSLICADKLRGESILAYLQKKGYPEVALRFVSDPSTRFELAIECGNIDDAFECCGEIDTPLVWNRFAEAAIMQGHYRYVTEAYKRTENFEKLPKEKDLLINQPDVIISVKPEHKINRDDSSDDDSVGSQFDVGDGDDDDDDEWNTKQTKTDTVEVGNITDDSLQLSDASGEEN